MLILVRDKIEDGTLDTIKQGLSDQTEVFVVFNTSATSPRALKPIEADTKQTREMVEKVQKALPQSYKGFKGIYALPALLSQASCLLPSDYGSAITKEQQDKFLAKYTQCGDDVSCQREQLSQESCLSDFATFIATLATDTKDKIRRSVFTKANAILGEFGSVVDGVAIDFAKLFSKTQQNIDSLEVNIDKVCEANRQRFHSIVSNELQVFINQVRENIHKEIAKNISDDEFKSFTESTLKDESPKLEATLKEQMDKQAQELHTDLHDEFKDFERKSSSDFTNFQQALSQNLSGILSFGEIDSGISWAGLAGVGIGAAGMIGGIIMAGTAASGGLLVIALGAISLGISAYKSIRKFFSDSYKQAEQRKSLAKALDTLQENITEQYCKNIANHIEGGAQALPRAAGSHRAREQKA